MEPSAHLLHRHQHGRDGKEKGYTRRGEHLDDLADVSDDTALQHLPGTSEARTVSALPGANALHSTHRNDHPPTQPCIPPHPEMGQQGIHVCRRTELGVLPHPHPLRTRLHREVALDLLAHFPHLCRHHPTCRLGIGKTCRLDFPKASKVIKGINT